MPMAKKPIGAPSLIVGLESTLTVAADVSLLLD